MNETRTPASVSNEISYEKFVDDKLTLTLPSKKLDPKPSVVSLQISYIGKEGVEDVFRKNEDLILDLIRTKAASFSLNELQKGHELARFESEVLKTINGFVADKMFIKVQISNLKEI